MSKYEKTFWSFIRKICERDQIPFTVNGETEDMVEVSITCSEDRLLEVLEDAMCERQRDETAAKIPLYSYRTLKNKEKLHRLQALNGKKGFHVLKQDMGKCQAEGLI